MNRHGIAAAIVGVGTAWIVFLIGYVALHELHDRAKRRLLLDEKLRKLGLR
jgi:hypothetical protein